MDVSEVIAVAAEHLRGRYEPLLLTFYGERARPGGDHVLIGDDYGTELRVRLVDGAVVSVGPGGELRHRFVNLSVELLARFIDAYRSSSGQASTAAEVAPAAWRVREGLAATAPAAFDDPEN